jgi:hypothetical protein
MLKRIRRQPWMENLALTGIALVILLFAWILKGLQLGF